MKKNRVKIVISLLIISVFFILVFSPSVHAANKSTDSDSLDSWMDQAKSFVSPSTTSPVDMSQVGSVVRVIARALVAVASVILVGVTIIMGIKYVTCQSADQKAKLKTQLIGLGVATIVIFGAQIIWSTLYNIMNKV